MGEHTGSAMKHVSQVLKYRAAAAGGGLLIAYNSLPSLCAEVNDRRHGPTGNRDETFQQMFVKLAEKELEQDPQVRSEESQAEAWTALGVAGGATVGGVHYSGKQCFDNAVKLNAKSPATWTHLGIEQGTAPNLTTRLNRLPINIHKRNASRRRLSWTLPICMRGHISAFQVVAQSEACRIPRSSAIRRQRSWSKVVGCNSTEHELMKVAL